MHRPKEFAQGRKMIFAVCLTLLFCTFAAANELNVIDADLESLDPIETLQCHRRLYTYKVSQEDVNGRQCRDTLRVWACWGRCDSNEISDYRFPFKKSTHPVCVHDGRTRAVAILRDCDEDALPSTARYEYLEAASCRCQRCSSSDTSCEGISRESVNGFSRASRNNRVQRLTMFSSLFL